MSAQGIKPHNPLARIALSCVEAGMMANKGVAPDRITNCLARIATCNRPESMLQYLSMTEL
jgi:hypothetical protein